MELCDNTFWTATNLSFGLIARLADVPNIVGLKWATPRTDAMEFEDVTSHFSGRFTVIDNTGAWRDQKGLSQHLKSTGVSKVLLTAPTKAPIKNIIAGVTSDRLSSDDNILGAASCTTNAIVPVLELPSPQ